MASIIDGKKIENLLCWDDGEIDNFFDKLPLLVTSNAKDEAFLELERNLTSVSQDQVRNLSDNMEDIPSCNYEVRRGVIQEAKKKECQFCHCNFRYIAKHMVTHTGKRPYVCDICKVSFTQKSNLNRHIKSKHDSGGRQCPHCLKVYKRNDKLKLHMRTHD